MSNQVTVDSVLWAYRLLLDREPENLEIIYEKLSKFKTNQELVQDLINSQEFSSKQSGLLLSLFGNALELVGKTLKVSNNFIQPTIGNEHLALGIDTEATTIIDKKGSAWTCIELGTKAKQEKDLVAADTYYKQAIEKNPEMPEHIYLEFKTIQEQLGKESEARETYKSWIEREYLVEHNNQVIYCPIAKNACTLLKNVLIEISDKHEEFKKSDLKIHKYIDSNKHIFQLNNFDYINREDYFKFIILRNPFKRVISTYADKFVNRLNKNDPHAIPVIEEVYQYLGLPVDFQKSITFNQFVEHLLRTEDAQLDSHWRPQSIYFASGLVKFDYVGQFEKLERVIEDLEQRLNVKMDSGVSKHRTTYSTIASVENFHELYPSELKSLPSFPQSSQFYTQEIEELVRSRYSEDIAIYEENFGTKLEPINQ
jgi:tetratricopeptide (TPR) repeat protein